MQIHYRQGDILLLPTETTIKGLAKVPREEGRLILAHGEATGHAHAVLDFESKLFDNGKGVRILAVKTEAELIHDEHDTIKLPGNTYQVIRQTEVRRKRLQRVED